MMRISRLLIVLVVVKLSIAITAVAGEVDVIHSRELGSLLSGNFYWEVNQPVLSINPKKLPSSSDNPWHAVKDPSIVRYQGKWHLFCSLVKKKGENGLPPGYVRIGYMSFTDWKDAQKSQWHLLKLSMDYHGAPEVFYFTPQKKWYLIYQLEDRYHNMPYGPYYSTTVDITDPNSWSQPTPFYSKKPSNLKGFFGLDFWIICDKKKAYLFFTTCNGRMWRADTNLQDFPKGFGQPEVVLLADVFEASHTYLLRGLNKYLTLIEAKRSGWFGGYGQRYYKAYISDKLDGEWKELAASINKPFAGAINVRHIGTHWTDSFSHCELIRTGYDEKLEVNPKNIRVLFQGADTKRRNPAFRLGLLKPFKD